VTRGYSQTGYPNGKIYGKHQQRSGQRDGLREKMIAIRGGKVVRDIRILGFRYAVVGDGDGRVGMGRARRVSAVAVRRPWRRRVAA
jgi:ribosomal protein S5